VPVLTGSKAKFPLATLVADLQIAAQRGRPTFHNCTHRARLLRRQLVFGPIIVQICPQDIGYFVLETFSLAHFPLCIFPTLPVSKKYAQRCVHVLRRFGPEPCFAGNQIGKNRAEPLQAEPGHVQLGLLEYSGSGAWQMCDNLVLTMSWERTSGA
jgi:hypothetical protein